MKDVVIHIERNNEEQKQRAIEQLRELGYDSWIESRYTRKKNFDCIYGCSVNRIEIHFHEKDSGWATAIPLKP